MGLLASTKITNGTFRLSGLVEEPGRGRHRSHRVRLPIELTVTNAISYAENDEAGTGMLILESAESFGGGITPTGVIPCTVIITTREGCQMRLNVSVTPVAVRRWRRWLTSHGSLAKREPWALGAAIRQNQPVAPAPPAMPVSRTLDEALFDANRPVASKLGRKPGQKRILVVDDDAPLCARRLFGHIDVARNHVPRFIGITRRLLPAHPLDTARCCVPPHDPRPHGGVRRGTSSRPSSHAAGPAE